MRVQTGLFFRVTTQGHPYKGFGLVCANGLVFPDSPVACDLTPVLLPHDHPALASPWRRNHGICTNNVRMQTKRLLLGMEKLSAPLTDEVVHEHPALASTRGTDPRDIFQPRRDRRPRLSENRRPAPNPPRRTTHGICTNPVGEAFRLPSTTTAPTSLL